MDRSYDANAHEGYEVSSERRTGCDRRTGRDRRRVERRTDGEPGMMLTEEEIAALIGGKSARKDRS